MADQTDLQVDADKLLLSARRIRWITVTVLVTAFATGLAVLGVIAFQEHRQITASCGFYSDLGTVPLPVTSAGKGPKPSELGVRLVLHSRLAFTGQGCPGTLPAPGAGLVKWARYYHLPLIPQR